MDMSINTKFDVKILRYKIMDIGNYTCEWFEFTINDMLFSVTINDRGGLYGFYIDSVFVSNTWYGKSLNNAILEHDIPLIIKQTDLIKKMQNVIDKSSTKRSVVNILSD